MSAPIFIQLRGFGETEEEFNAAAKATAAEGAAATVEALQTQANVTYTPPPAPAYTPPPAPAYTPPTQEPLRAEKPPTIIERIFGPSQPSTPSRDTPRAAGPSMLDWSNEGFMAAMGSGGRSFKAATGIGVPLIIGGVAVLGLIGLVFAASQRSTR